MISALNSLNTLSYQQKSQKPVSFGSKKLVMEPPMRFKSVKNDLLYAGGFINSNEELDFLINKIGIRSILSFLDPKDCYQRMLLDNELKFINQHNNKHPKNIIFFDSLPCWIPIITIRENSKKYKEALAKKIENILTPIYMHCLAGEDVTGEMIKLFQEAEREGKINFRI